MMDLSIFANRTALVTGASSGLGADFAQILAEAGCHLILTARRIDRLESLRNDLTRHGVDVRIHAADLADPGGLQSLIDFAQHGGKPVEILINNAGFGLRGAFATLDPAPQAAMLDLNIKAPMLLARTFLPPMLARGQGWVLNVASTAAFQPGPYMAVYYASKAFILSLSEALYEETRGRSVVVTALCPGATHTEFADAAAMTDSALFRYAVMKSRPVAEAGLRGLALGRRMVIPGLHNKIGALGGAIMPRPLTFAVVKKLHQ